jgi:deazaflavin-dependent oxidoreductase (nitroreductase family)
MMRWISRLVRWTLLAVVTIGVVFVVGMRRKSPLVLDNVRRAGKAMKPLVLRSSGTPGGMASVVRHVGRSSGRAYETPVTAVPTADGFVIALPYGPNTDWLKNVLASGSATIVHEGGTHRVEHPQIVATSEVADLFSPGDQRAHRLFRVEECLRVRRAEPTGTDAPGR